MAKSLGAQVLALLDHDRVDLRAAAATVLASVGAGDASVQTGLLGRLDDPDPIVRRIALEGLVAQRASGMAPYLVAILKRDDATLAERAAELLTDQGGAAEAPLRNAVSDGPVAARRVIASQLLRLGTPAALEAILDQFGDAELGEYALQMIRHNLDHRDNQFTDKLWTVTSARIADSGKRLEKEIARVEKDQTKARSVAARGKAPARSPPGKNSKSSSDDPTRDAALAPILAEHTALLRLLGYLARPQSQALLVSQSSIDRPRPIRFAAISALRRIVAASDAKHTEPSIAALIEYAGGDDLGIAQAAIDTLRGARIPETVAKAFSRLARSKNPAAQTLAMERLPAGGGTGAVSALIDALGGDDVTARDAAGRGLSKAPEAALPLVRALIAATDEPTARRYAAALRAHRGHVSTVGIDGLVSAAEHHVQLHAKGKATADTILLERVISDVISDVAPVRHIELLFERARRLRRAGKAMEAFAVVKPLLRTRPDLDAAIDDESRFLLAILGLTAMGQGILRASHAEDPVLAQFGRLARSGFPVARNLAREKEVEDQEIYGLGFRLLESPDEHDKALGAELLQGIVEERPRSKLAKQSRNKLAISGYADE